MHKPHILSKPKFLLILFILLLAASGIICFLGRSQSPQQQEPESPANDQMAEPAQRLLVSVVENTETADATLFSPESSDTSGKVYSRKLEQVNIQLAGVTRPLEEALRDSSVSFQEIVAWAALDAENGFCKEIVETERGLTMFRYKYDHSPDHFDLSVFQDVYQTPDGKEHLIRQCTFYPPGESSSLSSTIITNENGEYLDREDWGISLELLEASPSDITFLVHQSGGQYIGNLVTDTFYLDCRTTETSIYTMTKEFPIENAGTTTISLNWEDDCGKLPSGTYSLIFGVSDIFTEEQRHPLMLDYHQWQAYGLEFTIP